MASDLLHVTIVLLLQLHLSNSKTTTTENYGYEKSTQKCSTLGKIFRICKNPEIITTTPSVIIKEDEGSKNLGFSFSAFVITLFASLAIALTGAFACWCCRTFCRQGSFLSHHSRSITPPPSIYNNNGVALEPLVDDQESNQRRSYRRTNSLPSYSNVTSSTGWAPSAPPLEDPPPTYDSLFGSSHPENKS